MGSIATYIADKAAKKEQSPAEWLESNLKNLNRYWVSSHIGRYTHPDAAVHLHDNSGPTGKGYLTTADAAEIGRACVGKECSEPCRSRWSPYH